MFILFICKHLCVWTTKIRKVVVVQNLQQDLHENLSRIYLMYLSVNRLEWKLALNVNSLIKA